MRKSIVWVVVAVVIVALGGWYWYAHQTGDAVGDTAATGTAYVRGNLLLGTDANAKLGTYLIGSSGMTLYTYAPDTAGVSNCTGQCAANWPPYTIADASVLANTQAGVNGKAGTITRADGSMQVTYDGHPLYFYAQDAASGDTNGQGVGGVWYVVTP